MDKNENATQFRPNASDWMYAMAYDCHIWV